MFEWLFGSTTANELPTSQQPIVEPSSISGHGEDFELTPYNHPSISDLLLPIEKELRRRLGIDSVTELGIYYAYESSDTDDSEDEEDSEEEESEDSEVEYEVEEDEEEEEDA